MGSDSGSKLGSYRVLLLALAAGALVLMAAGAASAQATTKVQRSISFAANAAVPQAVRDQCQLQSKVPEFVAASAGSSVELVDGAVNRKTGRVLEMEITEVHAPGGGAFSGAKWMAVNGTLYDRGKAIGNFRAKRFSTGGAFGGFKGTCAIIGRCSKAIGEDIARWLAAPTANANLGDAQ
jgi:hypothetical protein